VTSATPTDTELLAAGGWSGVDDAVVLAKGWSGDFCAALINTHGGDESSVYFTIVECFTRRVDGGWESLGHSGPVGRDGGAGWHAGGGEYEYRWRQDRGWTVEVSATPDAG
jgi:hypothetical protein